MTRLSLPPRAFLRCFFSDTGFSHLTSLSSLSVSFKNSNPTSLSPLSIAPLSKRLLAPLLKPSLTRSPPFGRRQGSQHLSFSSPSPSKLFYPNFGYTCRTLLSNATLKLGGQSDDVFQALYSNLLRPGISEEDRSRRKRR